MGVLKLVYPLDCSIDQSIYCVSYLQFITLFISLETISTN